MKSIKIILLSLFMASSMSFSQVKSSYLIGEWQGLLNLGAQKLNIVFKIKPANGKFTATMDSPDQGAKDIAMDSVIVKNDSVSIFASKLNLKFSGVYSIDSIKGTFTQSAYNFQLNLSRAKQSIENIRPQDPVKPYPYNEREVTFNSLEEGVELSGTFTYPFKGGKFPVVILISGSGGQDRNEELMGHKPFLVLSDYLSRNGIAVLRFDDRGIGKSTGEHASASTFDFTKDVLGAVEFLRNQSEIDRTKIGLIGHSEGGLIAPLAANESEYVKFLVLLAAPGVRGDSLLILQSNALMVASGIGEQLRKDNLALSRSIYSTLLNIEDSTVLNDSLSKIFEQYYNSLDAVSRKMTSISVLKSQIPVITSNWFKTFIKLDPADALKKLQIPVLALNGTLDLQVPYKENLSAIEKSLKAGGNKEYKIKQLESLNHLFQKAVTGNINEYNQIQETMNPEAMKIIADWIKDVTKD